ncbi:MAG TPA: SAM-dependent methyltransferase [Candidatus Saccharimonadia bacterium]|nr:SAM-dependent methyltransferase [Candidatus Saccharimonadia bacterium]
MFWRGGQPYRQINTSAQAAYDQLMAGGLYERLVKDSLLVAHHEESEVPAGAYKVIRPELLELVTYPYEWSFSQLQDAALATLKVQRLALEHGLTLRDASAYNIQFVAGRPQLIDTLSFDVYEPGKPWIAYRQFCQHFLAPLALMSYVDVDLLQLLRVHLDGVPLPLAAKLLPLRASLKLGLATHIKLHARLQRQHEGTAKRAKGSVSQLALNGLLDSLAATTKALRLAQYDTQWADYYNDTNYNDTARTAKGQLIGRLTQQVKPQRIIDLGANNGPFSRIAAAAAPQALVISADIDPLAVDQNYRRLKAAGETRLMPLLVDLTNPSPGLGWANQERSSFATRAGADLAIALALIHHLAIASNVPLELVAAYFAELAPQLIIEFVPKEDSQVQRLLATREDIFVDYTPAGFEAAFGAHYETIAKEPVPDSARTLYLMRRRAHPKTIQEA